MSHTVARCLVCRMPIGDAAPVLCELCESPLHADCYEFWGQCTTYGCRGLRRTMDAPSATGPAPGAGTAYVPGAALWRSGRTVHFEETANLPALADGDRAIQLPKRCFAQLTALRKPNWMVPFTVGYLLIGFPCLVVFLMIACSFIGVSLDLAFGGICLVSLGGLFVLLGILDATGPISAWLVSGQKGNAGVLLHTSRAYLSAGPFEFGRHPFPGRSSAGQRGFVILRAMPIQSGLTQRGNGPRHAYNLRLGWSLEGDVPRFVDSGVDLADPVPIAVDADQRKEFLSALVRLKAHGELVAEITGMEFVVRADPEASELASDRTWSTRPCSWCAGAGRIRLADQLSWPARVCTRCSGEGVLLIGAEPRADLRVEWQALALSLGNADVPLKVEDLAPQTRSTGWRGTVTVSAGGLSRENLMSNDTCRWEEIQSISSSITERYVNGAFQGTDVRIRLARADGRDFTVEGTDAEQKGGPLFELLVLVQRVLYARMAVRKRIEFLRTGQALFGSLRLTEDGVDFPVWLGFARSSKSWSEIEGFTISGGRFALHTRGAYFPACSLALEKLPNSFVLSDLFAGVFAMKRAD